MGKIYCVMGKSASGKDTVYRMIRSRRPGLKEVVMYTTRPARAGEKDGSAYFFVGEDRIRQFEEEGKLIEKRTYMTVKGPWTYATADDGQICLSGNSYLVPATLQSFQKLSAWYGKENVIPLYVEVEDGERLLRAIRREQEQSVPQYREMCRRFLADCEDFSEEKIREAGITVRFENNDAAECAEEMIKVIDRG